jgi:DNA replicative helicase MCM subunit Mcm2 (Cdc46/Mcm family)
MAAYAQEPSESYLSLKRRFSDFIHEYQPARAERYVDRLEPLFGDEKRSGVNSRLLIDVHDLQQFDDKLHQGVLNDPTESLRPCIDAARDAARGLQDGSFGQKNASEVEACP